MIDLKYKNSDLSTYSIDIKQIENTGNNIYDLVHILSKRAYQINYFMRESLYSKIGIFGQEKDKFEKIILNDLRIKISKKYEVMTKPTSISIIEFLDYILSFKRIKKKTLSKII